MLYGSALSFQTNVRSIRQPLPVHQVRAQATAERDVFSRKNLAAPIGFGHDLLQIPKQNVEQIRQKKLSGDTTLKTAWENPVVRELVTRVIINGHFQAAPDIGRKLVAEIEKVCQSPRTFEKSIEEDDLYRYRKLHQFFKSTIEPQQQSRDSLKQDRQTQVNLRAQHIHSTLGDYRPQNYIDIGCGNGEISQAVTKILNIPAKNSFGLEVVKPSKPVPDYQILLYDGQSLPIKPGQIDLATMLVVLHHVEDPVEMLKAVYKIMKPGGKLVVRDLDVPNRDLQLFNLIIEHVFWRIYDDVPNIPMSGNYFGKAVWKQIFQEAGFKIQRFESLEPNNPFKPFLAILEKPQN